MTPQDYDAFRRFLEDASGITLGENKRYLVESRLGRLMADQGVATLGELLARAQAGSGAALRGRIVDAMTTNETLWFRDGAPFELLRQTVLPDLLARRIAQPRIWSAACSTGQEPYSISMIIQEFMATRPGSLGGAQIVATDISPSVLREAEAGMYEDAALARGMTADRRQRFFLSRNGRHEVKPELRARVKFRELNLKQSYDSLGRFDVIYCRNVLIYFSADLKRDIMARLARALNPGGYLFLGASESVAGYSDAFEMLRDPVGIVYRLKSQ